MPETQPTPPPSREELLLAFLLEQDGARRVMEGADSGVTFTTPEGTSLAYFLRPDGSDYVRNAAGREFPEYLSLLMDTVLGDPPTDPAVEAATPASSEVAVEAATPAGPEVAAVAACALLIEALPDQCRANPACAFEPDALDAMNALQRDDPGSFAVLWNALRRGRSISLRDLRAAMRRRAQLQYEAAAVADAGAGSEGGSQADRLIRLVQADMLFVGLQEEADSANPASGEVYLAMTVETHRETWPLSSNSFRHWLVQNYLAEHRSAPRSEAITQAIGTLDAMGRRLQSPRHVVYLRTARDDDTVWIDKCDERWRAYKATRDGWELVENPPVYFRRTQGMQELPDALHVQPISANGSTAERDAALREVRLAVLAKLRTLVNLRQGEEGDREFVLAWCWLLMTLSGRTKFPLLAIYGEFDTAKSSFMSLWRSLVDPHSMTTRSPPRDEDMLRVAMFNSFVLSFDNLSFLPPWLSDFLCRIATGAADGRRAHYENLHEIIVKACRPVMLTAIANVVSRSDLSSRTITLNLTPIAHDRIMSEDEFERQSGAVRPSALGVLLDGLVEGLRNEGRSRPRRRVRMGNFAEHAIACETAYWPAGTFMAAWEANQQETGEVLREHSPVAEAIIRLVKDEDWSGRRTDLLTELGHGLPVGERPPRGWPGNARALSAMLREVAPILREGGVFIEERRDETRSRARIVAIIWPDRPVPSERAPNGSGQPYLSPDPPYWDHEDPGPHEEPDRQMQG